MVVSFVYVVAMALGLGRPGEGVGNRTACAEGIEPPDFGHGAGRPVCQSYGSTQLLVRPLPAAGCGDESDDPGATNTSEVAAGEVAGGSDSVATMPRQVTCHQDSSWRHGVTTPPWRHSPTSR
jgi:hypothetical protein